MPIQLPALYAIIDRETLGARTISAQAFAQELRDAGVTCVQYRDKESGPQEILRTAKAIAEVFAGTNATLILNDRADLAVLAGWGVHVGQGDLPADAAKRMMLGVCARAEEQDAPDFTSSTTESSLQKGGGLVGVSTHTEEQVRLAEASGADYVAIGPVFATSSKKNPDAVVGLHGVSRARALTSKPLVAIGGITLENARSVVEAGADSIAVIGALLAEGKRTRDTAEAFLSVLR